MRPPLARQRRLTPKRNGSAILKNFYEKYPDLKPYGSVVDAVAAEAE